MSSKTQHRGFCISVYAKNDEGNMARAGPISSLILFQSWSEGLFIKHVSKIWKARDVLLQRDAAGCSQLCGSCSQLRGQALALAWKLASHMSTTLCPKPNPIPRGAKTQQNLGSQSASGHAVIAFRAKFLDWQIKQMDSPPGSFPLRKHRQVHRAPVHAFLSYT